MIKFFSTEFWVCTQLVIDLIFVMILLGLVKRVNTEKKEWTEPSTPPGNENKSADQAGKTARDIIEMLEPLVVEAGSAAKSFDKQIKEKKKLINGVNDALDTRIISINLLLSRAESLYRAQKEPASQDVAGLWNPSDNHRSTTGFAGSLGEPGDNEDVFDQQQRIIDLHTQGFGMEAIASKLAMPKGEVQLVVNLKQKFLKMENQG